MKEKLPLHIVHTIEWSASNDVIDMDRGEMKNNCHLLKYLRVFVRKPAHGGWGVSLWQVDVYGTEV